MRFPQIVWILSASLPLGATSMFAQEDRLPNQQRGQNVSAHDSDSSNRSREANVDSRPAREERASRDDNQWFWDFYDDGFAEFVDADNDGVYEYAARYFDFDQDGLYDGMVRYSNPGEDGRYRSVEYVAFDSSGNEMDREGEQNLAPLARRQRVTGQITRTKEVEMPGADHLVAQIEKENGRKVLVDLGPAENLYGAELNRGAWIAATGPVMHVGDKDLVLARRLEAGNETINIRRERGELGGEITRLRTESVQGVPHVLATIEDEDGEEALVDLGVPEHLSGIRLRQGEWISAAGPIVRFQDGPLLLAQRVRADGRTHQIPRLFDPESREQLRRSEQPRTDERQTDRTRPSRSQAVQGEERRVSGQVVATRKTSLDGSRHLQAKLETPNGEVVVVDLGPAERLPVELQQGDRISVHGVQRQHQGEALLMARQLRAGDETVQIQNGRETSWH